MKKWTSFFFLALLMFSTMLVCLTACSSSGGDQVTDGTTDVPETTVLQQEETEQTRVWDDDVAKPVDTESKMEESGKVLVAYFSATGTTKILAEYAADAMGADLYEIVPEEPYTEDDLNYSDRSTRATAEQDDKNVRPAISGSVENMDQYEIVFLAFPIWWGEEPRIMDTFVETYDFSGKTVVPVPNPIVI